MATSPMPAARLPARNVFNEPIIPCSFQPLTGFFRDGCCKTGDDDVGTHVVCAVMTDEFLEFSVARGNDLVTPVPEWGFPGLRAGDKWCLCALRWVEAWQAGMAPPVVLESTNFHALDVISLSVLQAHASQGDSGEQ
ncbi:DUF2237 family protein [Lacisediminimonas sp.]|uniref:DUF2237 family protein n=1 Tax=Lacisediminimonas sp. TaxID=3060582 RepID=UPI002728F4D1|nr:DUF2237 domain-containing protein [Lacisediminimonas sp.]MDO8300198.1 DUF2237 domain-containing protein [Lacisediminimonas sp.]